MKALTTFLVMIALHYFKPVYSFFKCFSVLWTSYCRILDSVERKLGSNPIWVIMSRTTTIADDGIYNFHCFLKIQMLFVTGIFFDTRKIIGRKSFDLPANIYQFKFNDSNIRER